MLLLVVAGDDTTKQATTLSLLALHDNPAERDWLSADFERRIDDALEEFIRYASPVTRPHPDGHGAYPAARCLIAAGDKVALFYCSGNRDATVFPSPETFNLRRPRAQHVAFGGGGVHFCLGSAVAKAQLKSLFREIFRRMPQLEVGEPDFIFSEFVHGVRALPVRVVR